MYYFGSRIEKKMRSPFETPPTRARLRDCFDHQTKMVGRFSSFPPTTSVSFCPSHRPSPALRPVLLVLVIHVSTSPLPSLTSRPPVFSLPSPVTSVPQQALDADHYLNMPHGFWPHQAFQAIAIGQPIPTPHHKLSIPLRISNFWHVKVQDVSWYLLWNDPFTSYYTHSLSSCHMSLVGCKVRVSNPPAYISLMNA